MKKLIAVRIERELLKKLEEIAEKDDRTVSYLIRKAIEKFAHSQSKRGRQ